MRYSAEKMIAAGNIDATVNGRKRVLINNGLSENAVAAYDYEDDQIIGYCLTENDEKLIESFRV